MARVILTGATGLLGAEVTDRLVADGDEVICLGRRAPDNPQAVHIEMDLTRPVDRSRLPARADAVIHLAQCDAYRDFPRGALDVFAINVAAPCELLDWASGAGAGSFVLASSGGVYGGGPATPYAEDAPIRLEGPLAHYLSTKRAAELLALPYADHFSVAAMRYFFIYGRRQKETMLMRRLVGNVKAGRPLTLQDTDGMRFNPVHVTDAAEATIAAMRGGKSGIYNVAGPEMTSIRAIGETAGALLGIAPVFSSGEGRPNHMLADISLMSRDLCAPVTGIRAGLEDLCAIA